MKNIYLFIIGLLLTSNLHAQAFSIDTTFNLAYSNFYFPTSSGNVFGINSEPDAKLMIYGYYGGGGDGIRDIIRIYENGSLDTSWHAYSENGIEYLRRFGDNYVVESDGILFKLNYWGQYQDTVYYNHTIESNICGYYYNPYMLSDGSILIGADSTCYDTINIKRCLMKLLPNGRIDTNFKHSTNWPVVSPFKYSSDKLLLFGGFTKYDSIPINCVCRIDTLGNLDTTFNSIFTSGSPQVVYVQNDGKIIVDGDFNFLNSATKSTFIRLNPNGTLDSTFNNFNSINLYLDSTYESASVVCPTSDGGYLVGGRFDKYQGYVRHNIAKTDANGFIDTAYFNGLGIDSTHYPGDKAYINNIVHGNNDTYYVMGYFTNYEGQHVNPIIRVRGLSSGIEEEKEVKNEIQLYPNPAKNEVNLSFSKAIANGMAEIYDVSGIKVKEILFKGRQSHYVISTESLAAGFYI
ncbi:MAG: T9SS type A sorting domain-containing protein, partial [Bacteroidota bacterium]